MAMSDLIDRQAAINEIYETFCYAYCDNCEKEMNEDLCGDCHRKYQNWSASKKTIEKVINNLPSAQPEVLAHGEGELSAQPEPKKGKWIPNKDDTAGCGYFICSACKRDFYNTYNYCPNCGADMRGGDAE